MPTELGTGFVPQSAEATAEAIAGQQALNQAALALAQAAAEAAGQAASGQPGSPSSAQGPAASQAQSPMGEGQPGQSQAQSPMPGDPSAAKTGGAASGSKSAQNPDAQPGELENTPAAQADSRGEKADQDSTATAQKYEREPWFAKLPPALQNAIQAKARGKAPRGYEERLRRYFESVD